MKASPAIHPQSAPGVRHGGGRYSGLRLLLEGLRGQRGWPRAWAKAVPRPRYQVVIVGGGGHGLATAYYLASAFGITDVAVLEKGPIGLGNVGRNTTLIRSNYFHPDNIRFYDYSLQLWERMERTLNFNTMVSQRGTLNLFHTEAQRDLFTRRANAMRVLGVDAEALSRSAVKRLVPLIDLDNGRFPVLGGFLQRRGGTVRHDAVAWGYARAASRAGVDIVEHCEVSGIRRTGAARHRRRHHPRPYRRRPRVSGRGRSLLAPGVDGGPAPADRDSRAAGLCHREHQAHP